MQEVRFDTQFSSLCSGELLEPEKGLPPPKVARCKDSATEAFLQAFGDADHALAAIAAFGIALGDADP